jgi:hypothetical protein
MLILPNPLAKTEKFMSRLSELDAEWTDRVARAKAAGKVLR